MGREHGASSAKRLATDHQSNQKLLVWNLQRPSAPSASATEYVATPTSADQVRLPGGSHYALRRRTIGDASANSGGSSLTHRLARSQRAGQTPGGSAGASVHLAPRATAAQPAVEQVLDAHMRAITDINWSPVHPEVLASCSVDTWTWVWDLRVGASGSRRPVQGYSSWNASMAQVKWNRIAPHRIAVSCDNKVLIWDDRKGALPLATIEAHRSKIYGLDWSPYAEHSMDQIVTCSLDGTIKCWDLMSETSQEPVRAAQPITEPEYTIAMDYPVWRARHLPFGRGIMAAPQRGDSALSMWRCDALEEPARRFTGHSDVVKEFLFRSRGGASPSDERAFQLVTWSKDQTLRLWPIGEDVLRAAGREPGEPLEVYPPAYNAPNISYRDPSNRAETPPPADRATPISIAGQPAPPTSSSDGDTSSVSSPMASSLPGRTDLVRSLPSIGTRAALASGARRAGAEPASVPTSKAAPGWAPSSPKQRCPRPAPLAPLSGSTPSVLPPTRRPQMHYYRTTGIGRANAFTDPVGWMARVQLSDADEGDGTALADADAVLRSEIMHVSSRFPLALEAVDLAKRCCTVAVYGPRGGDEGISTFLRVSLTFPSEYPHVAPQVKLEKNSNVPLRNRAQVQQELVGIVERHAEADLPSLEACVAYLCADTQEPEDEATRFAQEKTLPEELVAQALQSVPGYEHMLADRGRSPPEGEGAPAENSRFLRSYRALLGAVVDLSLRATDGESRVWDLDVMKLLETPGVRVNSPASARSSDVGTGATD